ncbi:MAG TPA: hypothetical protein VJQ47_05175 [Steroidobacteraceae bacterium]|nr:hypothetical protein [Steroidobacteraceae bacterium]
MFPKAQWTKLQLFALDPVDLALDAMLALMEDRLDRQMRIWTRAAFFGHGTSTSTRAHRPPQFG